MRRENASALTERYPEESPVTVYYDPSDPTAAVLQPGASPWGIVRSAFTVLLVLGMGVLLAGFGLVHAVRR